jgi:ABC-type multidrug transport system permease subunit
MRKLLTVLGKNFKLLFRKKTSLFTIIFGPLIIIMILAIAFSSTSNIKMSIGYINPDDSSMTLEFIDTLNEKYLIKEHGLKEDCVRELEQGLIHGCIVFPSDFNIENNKTNNVIFIVDNSRISLVYSVLESISEQIDIKSEELSKDMTGKLLDTLSSTSQGLDSSVALIVKIRSNLENEKESITNIESELSKIDTNTGDVDVGDVLKDISSLETKTTDSYETTIEDLNTCLTYVTNLKASGVVGADITSLENDLKEIKTYLTTNLDRDGESFEELVNTTKFVEKKIKELEDKLEDIESNKESQIKNLVNLKNKLNSISEDLNTLKLSLESMQTKIRNIEITSTENIVNPITTTIETISSEENRLGMIFPYALMLIIMFVSLLLASTLVVVEKQSNAAFRTFTTPTRDEFFLITTFLTAFIIIVVQIALILGVASYFNTNLILSNIYVNVVLLMLGIALFVMLGMAIGYIFSTQQATNMTTITLSTIFLFLSNIVFPLETISPILAEVAKYNPFVITSEVLRKSILFNITFEKIIIELSMLFAYSVIFFIMIVIFQKLSKIKYLRRVPRIKSKINKLSIESIIIADQKITNKNDLIRKLHEITDDDYITFVKKNKKEFNEFLTNTISKKIGNAKRYKRIKLIEKIEKEHQKIRDRLEKNKETHILFDEDEEKPKKKFDDNENKDKEEIKE